MGLVVVWVGLSVLFDVIWPQPLSVWFSGFVAGAAMTLVIALRLTPPGSIEMWQDGAYGEEATAKELSKLPAERWTVLHDLANGTFNFDHVVIGPPGIFCLNSKFSGYRLEATEAGALIGVHVDDATLTKRFDRDIRAAKWEAVSLRGQIEKRSGRKVWVQPVIVWWGPYPDGGRTVDGVAVVQGKELVSRISRLPERRVTDLEAVCEVLRPGRHRG